MRSLNSMSQPDPELPAKVPEKKKEKLVDRFKRVIGLEDYSEDGEEGGEVIEKKEEKKVLSVDELYHNRFGIVQEDLQNIPGFDALSEGQKRLVAENLLQLNVGRIKEDALAGHNKENAERGFWGQVWSGISKNYKIAEREKRSEKELRTGGLSVHAEILKHLVAGAAGGPEIKVSKEGKLEVQYLDERRLDGIAAYLGTPEYLKKEFVLTLVGKMRLKRFNEAATVLGNIPYESSLPSASSSERRVYGEAKKKYENAKGGMLQILGNTFGIENAVRLGNQLEQQIRQNQFLNTNPDAEKALEYVRNTSSAGRMITPMVGAWGASFGAGLLGRSATGMYMATVIGNPLAAAGISSITGFFRAKKEIREEASAQRHGKKMTESRLLNRGRDRGERETDFKKIVSNRSIWKHIEREKKDYASAENLTQRVEKLSEYIESLNNVIAAIEQGGVELAMDKIENLDIRAAIIAMAKGEKRDTVEETRRAVEKGLSPDTKPAKDMTQDEAKEFIIAELKRQREVTPRQLDRLIKYSIAKIDGGLVDFGELSPPSGSKRKSQIVNQQQLSFALGYAQALLAGEEIKMEGKSANQIYQKRFEKALLLREQKMRKENVTRIAKKMVFAGVIGAGASIAGRIAGDMLHGWWNGHTPTVHEAITKEVSDLGTAAGLTRGVISGHGKGADLAHKIINAKGHLSGTEQKAVEALHSQSDYAEYVKKYGQRIDDIADKFKRIAHGEKIPLTEADIKNMRAAASWKNTRLGTIAEGYLRDAEKHHVFEKAGIYHTTLGKEKNVHGFLETLTKHFRGDHGKARGILNRYMEEHGIKANNHLSEQDLWKRMGGMKGQTVWFSDQWQTHDSPSGLILGNENHFLGYNTEDPARLFAHGTNEARVADALRNAPSPERLIKLLHGDLSEKNAHNAFMEYFRIKQGLMTHDLRTLLNRYLGDIRHHQPGTKEYEGAKLFFSEFWKFQKHEDVTEQAIKKMSKHTSELAHWRHFYRYFPEYVRHHLVRRHVRAGEWYEQPSTSIIAEKGLTDVKNYELLEPYLDRDFYQTLKTREDVEHARRMMNELIDKYYPQLKDFKRPLVGESPQPLPSPGIRDEIHQRVQKFIDTHEPIGPGERRVSVRPEHITRPSDDIPMQRTTGEPNMRPSQPAPQPSASPSITEKVINNAPNQMQRRSDLYYDLSGHINTMQNNKKIPDPIKNMMNDIQHHMSLYGSDPEKKYKAIQENLKEIHRQIGKGKIPKELQNALDTTDNFLKNTK